MTALDQILALTDAIEDRVNAGDWAGATGLDAERRHLLHDLFAADPQAARDSRTRAVLEQLRARNDAAVGSLTAARQALAAAARQLTSAPGAVRAYERNTAPAGFSMAAQAAGD
jgi:hypothetical protein